MICDDDIILGVGDPPTSTATPMTIMYDREQDRS